MSNDIVMNHNPLKRRYTPRSMKVRQTFLQHYMAMIRGTVQSLYKAMFGRPIGMNPVINESYVIKEQFYKLWSFKYNSFVKFIVM